MCVRENRTERGRACCFGELGSARLRQDVTFTSFDCSRLLSADLADLGKRMGTANTNGTSADADKHKQLPGYKLAKLQYESVSWIPYLASAAALASSTIVQKFCLPGYFYVYIACVPYLLYIMASSKYFMLGRHKFYVDGVQRPIARGWSQTLLLFFVYPLLAYHMLFDPESEDTFLAPRW